MAQKYHVIGLMSGTSLDGLDLAFVTFSKTDKHWAYDLKAVQGVPYDERWRQRLAGAINLAESELEQLDLDYGHWLGQQVQLFRQKHNLEVDFIASHGHTVFHEPEKGITRQIGAGQALANDTNLAPHGPGRGSFWRRQSTLYHRLGRQHEFNRGPHAEPPRRASCNPTLGSTQAGSCPLA